MVLSPRLEDGTNGDSKPRSCSAAAAAKGCPSNGEGSIQEINPTPRRKMIAFTWLLANRGNRKKKRRRQGELRAQAVVTSSHLSEEETQKRTQHFESSSL